MRDRCPEYRETSPGRLDGWRWIITARGYASIVLSKNDYVLGAVYELSESDVRQLDLIEGVTQGHYRKETLSIKVDGEKLDCLVYIDGVVENGRPREEYIARINNGIQDAGFPDEYVIRYLRAFVPGQPVT